jgi:hypothetical protein
LTAANKYFSEPPSLPDIQILIWYKPFNSWLPGLLLKKGKGYACVSTVSTDPLKHYGFLFRASGPEKPMNMSNKVMTAPQRETPKDEQMEQATYKSISTLEIFPSSLEQLLCQCWKVTYIYS